MSTRRSPSLSKNSRPTPPAGGAFLATGHEPGDIFTPDDLSAEARLMGQTMDGFVRQEVLPAQVRLEKHEPGVLRGLVAEAGKLGILAGSLPHPYGLALPKTTLALLAEKSGIDLSFAVTIGVHAGVAAYPLLFFGTDEQRARYLPGIAHGERAAAFALTEANAGSDALALETHAIPAGSGRYVLDGTKLWVTNAGIADLFTVFAQVEGAGPAAFLVERGAPGLAVGSEENKMGLRGSSTCRVMLTNTPAELLGEVGKGHLPALYALNLGRFQIGAISLGAAKEALTLAIRYAGHRRQQDRPIAEFGLIQQKLAGMAARIFALESMIYRVAGYWDMRLARAEDQAATLASLSEEYAIECALIKFFGSEVLGFAADQALQIHGGYGFSEDFPIARLYRDSRVFRIFEGTIEINRLAVAQQIRRRLERGRLALGDAIARASEPITWPAPDDILSFTQAAAAQIRRVVLVTLAKAGEMADQEIAAHIADLCLWLFALESAFLRWKKAPDALGTAPMLSLLADTACHEAGEFARSALVHAGADAEAVSMLLLPLFQRPAIDVIALRPRVAQAAVENNGCGS